MNGLALAFHNWVARIAKAYGIPPAKTDEDARVIWEGYLIPALCDEIYAYLAHYESIS